jgi:hypothetical protein
MYYAIEGRGFSGGLITQDGVVLHATRDFEWACGERIEMVLGFLDRQRVSWSVTDATPRGMVVDEGLAQWAH